MCSTAAASDGTTAAEMSADRYSVAKSSSVAGTTAAECAATSGEPCTVTPASANAASTRGRNASATSACTSSDSAVLQVDSRWVFELSAIATALSRSAAAST